MSSSHCRFTCETAQVPQTPFAPDSIDVFAINTSSPCKLQATLDLSGHGFLCYFAILIWILSLAGRCGPGGGREPSRTLLGLYSGFVSKHLGVTLEFYTHFIFGMDNSYRNFWFFKLVLSLCPGAKNPACWAPWSIKKLYLLSILVCVCGGGVYFIT